MNAFTPIGIDPIPRDELYRRWKDDHEKLLKEARNHKLTLPFYLEQLSPVPVKGYPADAFGHLLACDNLGIRSNSTTSTATVMDFLQEGGRKELALWTQLDLDYDLCSSVHEYDLKEAGYDVDVILENRGFLTPDAMPGGGEKFAASASTDAGTPDNTPFRPRYTRALYENRKFRPPVAIADIASGIETIPGTTFQIPKYDVPAEDEYSVIVPEGGRMNVTTLKTETTPGQTFKVGEGLATSREFELNDLRMQAVRLWVRRVAMRHETVIVNRGINLLRANAGDAVNIGATPDLSSILDVVLHFVDQVSNGYMIDKLFALKAETREWMVAGMESNANRVPFGPVQGRYSDTFTGTRLGGRYQEPPYIYPVGPTSTDANIGVTLQENDLLGIDSRFGLIMYRQMRGLLQEEKYDAESQLRKRFLSQRNGWQPQDADAIVRFVYANR